MNPLPFQDKDPVDTTRGDVHPSIEMALSVHFSEAAHERFSDWMDTELVRLEEHFRDYMTSRSRKRSLGR